MSYLQVALLAMVQGAAELLPVSSSAHVIVAEKLMGLDPSSPEMTFLLVMLHSGTMVAALFYFWPRWKKLNLDFFKMVILATAVTGVAGLLLKIFIEKVIFGILLGESQGEIEHLFKSLPLIGAALFGVGVLIILSGNQQTRKPTRLLEPRSSIVIGLVQGLCLPFRGFSRSGATISTSLLLGIPQARAEDFSFALAVLLTPPVVFLELHRLLKASGLGFKDLGNLSAGPVGQMMVPGFLGMIMSFGAGLLALRWLSSWLENHRWRYFGVYCILASVLVLSLGSFL